MPVSESEGAGRANGLHLEKVGANVVLRRQGDDDENERRFFASVPSSPGNSAVFATTNAATVLVDGTSRAGIAGSNWPTAVRTSPAAPGGPP